MNNSELTATQWHAVSGFWLLADFIDAVRGLWVDFCCICVATKCKNTMFCQ